MSRVLLCENPTQRYSRLHHHYSFLLDLERSAHSRAKEIGNALLASDGTPDLFDPAVSFEGWDFWLDLHDALQDRRLRVQALCDRDRMLRSQEWRRG